MIMLVTDRRRLSPGATESESAGHVVELVEAASDAGIDLIQVRERDLDTNALVSLVRRCVAAVKHTQARVLVNERIDVALAAGAHGVNLRADSVDADAARSLLPGGSLVGRSVHGVDQAVRASERGGLDYVILGTFFQTPSKDGSPRFTSLEELSALRGVSSIPVLAIGGMTVERAGAVIRAGAAGIAAIGLFIPPPGESVRGHLQKVAPAVRRAFDTCGVVS